MEEFNAIFTAINTVGFPIAACIGMFYIYNQVVTKITEALTDLRSVVNENSELVREAIRALNGGSDV